MKDCGFQIADCGLVEAVGGQSPLRHVVRPLGRPSLLCSPSAKGATHTSPGQRPGLVVHSTIISAESATHRICKSTSNRSRFAFFLCFFLGILLSAHAADSVVVYTSQDQEYAEPILKTFTEKTGIKVLPVYDSEAVKTVGLVNRLIAEKNHPQCDLFWNNEELRMRQLVAQKVLAETNGWDVFGFRTRQLVFNTNLLAKTNLPLPKSMAELTNQIYYGKIALAYPLFGTTSTHFLALRQLWGADHWKNWCEALQANKPFVVDGNSVVVRLVGKGEALIGVTDSDDALAGQREGYPITAFRLQSDGLKIQNTIGIIRNRPHYEASRQLMDYLRSAEVVKKLHEAGAVEEDKNEKTIQVDWDELIKTQSNSMETLKTIFLR